LVCSRCSRDRQTLRHAGVLARGRGYHLETQFVRAHNAEGHDSNGDRLSWLLVAYCVRCCGIAATLEQGRCAKGPVLRDGGEALDKGTN
jgi:hypothetical protein